ncbi:CDC27 family protein [uncultured Polaribacter sp.]|uniref:CDC27 family protein n=1 Tax=uncultured Polaribacter sp. TaxID=174711 RepID=UPI0030DD0B97
MLFYYLTIGLQVFCMYHAYKNSSSYYWYFIIFFLPLIGCIIYLFTQVINKQDINTITEEITTIINPTKKIKDLEKNLEFSNTFQNKVNLANAYHENKDYTNAILYYEKALEGNFKDDPYTINKLVHCYFETANFDKVIEYATKIDINKEFNDSLYFYGLALEKKGMLEEAEIQLKKVDRRYANYPERLELSKFLIRHQKTEEAQEILSEMSAEITAMASKNRKKHNFILTEVQKLLNK